MNTRDPFYQSGHPHACGGYPNRRQFLQRAGAGFGAVALAALMEQCGMMKSEAAAVPESSNPLLPKQPQFAARAKSVIWCFMNGGPSAIDLFDPKPELDRCDGQAMNKGNIVTFSKKVGPLMKSPFKF